MIKIKLAYDDRAEMTAIYVDDVLTHNLFFSDELPNLVTKFKGQAIIFVEDGTLADGEHACNDWKDNVFCSNRYNEEEE